MDTHVRIFAVLSIVFGICATLLSILILLYFEGFTGLFINAEQQGLGLIAVAFAAVHLLIGIPCAVIGFFVGRFQDWARSVMIVLLAINLLNPPFGSVLALYGLWVLMTPETDPLFTDPPRWGRPVSGTRGPFPPPPQTRTHTPVNGKVKPAPTRLPK